MTSALFSLVRSWRFSCLALVALLAGSPAQGREEEKPKETNAPAPPRLVVALPPIVVRGITNTLTLRGQRLKELTRLEAVVAGVTNELTLAEISDAAVPDRYKAEQTGDQQMKIEIFPAADVPGGTNLLLNGVSGAGSGESLPLWVVNQDEFDSTTKAAAGFREAPRLIMGRFIQGRLDKRGEVAVYRIEGQAGQALQVELWAQRLGSTLDASLTLHDARGAVLLSVDDVHGRDPVLEATLPVSGTYFLSVAGLDERVSPTHVYLLRPDLK